MGDQGKTDGDDRDKVTDEKENIQQDEISKNDESDDKKSLDDKDSNDRGKGWDEPDDEKRERDFIPKRPATTSFQSADFLKSFADFSNQLSITNDNDADLKRGKYFVGTNSDSGSGILIGKKRRKKEESKQEYPGLLV